jgi:hypothetical protein
MGISEITLYNLLRKKMGEQETYELVEFIHTEVKAELDAKTNILLTKEDKVDMIDRINQVKTELIIWIVSVGILQYLLPMLTKKFF